MSQRPLLRVVSNTPLGVVAHDESGARFEGATAGVFAQTRAEQGDDVAARTLVADGWSNGYLYLGDPEG